MDGMVAGEALDRVILARDEIRCAEIHQAVALAELAESYSVDVETLVPELAEKTIHPGGDGTPGISEFLALELGPALGMTRRSALNLVVSVLDLKHRHPRTWDAFCRGLVPAWQAHKLVELTLALSAEAAAWVDERIGRHIGRLPFGRLKRLVTGWVAQSDPALAARREAEARASRQVAVVHDGAGTSSMYARLDSRDAFALEKTISELAVALGEAGDERSHQQRRAAALGLLADPHTALGWLTGDTAAGEWPSGTSAARPRRGRKGRTVVYVHLSEETLVDPDAGIARVEGFGPLTPDSLAEFLAGTNVTVRPVVDDARMAPVDSYEIPEQIRESVRRGCPFEGFPYSNTGSGGLDLDHLVAYKFGHLWESGQTSVAGLAPLSRIVHRAKTLGAWKVRRTSLGELTWTSPLGRRYLVGPRGTRPPPGALNRRDDPTRERRG